MRRPRESMDDYLLLSVKVYDIFKGVHWSKKKFYKKIHCSHILQNYWFKLCLVFLYKVTYFLAVLRESVQIICAGYVACGFITGTVILRTVLYVYFYNLPLREVLSYSTI